jgi:hypothetical protein
MAGSRPVTGPTLAQAGAGAAKVGWLLEIDWSTPVYLSSYGDVSWSGQQWKGAGLKVGDFADSGKPNDVTISDPIAELRTIVLTDGLRDKNVMLWKVYPDAVGADDPLLLFDGFADGVEISGGKVSFGLDWASTSRMFTPRERIGPSIGVHFVAIPGTKISWYGQVLVIEKR